MSNYTDLERNVHTEYINRMMGDVISPETLPEWWETPITRLQDRSPQELLEEHPELLLGYVAGYSVFFMDNDA